jgi:hypothetical protein
LARAADFFLVDSLRLDFAGALFDDGALPVVAGISQNVDMTIVGGKVVVKEGRLVRIDEERVAISAQAAAERMLQTASKHTGIDYRFHRRGN